MNKKNLAVGILVSCCGLGAWTVAAAPVEGEIQLKRGLSLKPGMVLFLSARPPQGGPPVAVKRVDRFEFPLKFSLSEADSMMALTGAKPSELTGETLITARLSQRGDALSRTPGDLHGQVKARFGDKGVKLTIDQVQK